MTQRRNMLGSRGVKWENQEICVGHDKLICLLDIYMRKPQLKGKVWETDINLNIISTEMLLEASPFKRKR